MRDRDVTSSKNEDRNVLQSVEGVYKDGKLELLEPVPPGTEGRVIVTFLGPSTAVELRDRGIDQTQAEDLRRRLSTFAEDWERPEMDVYDAV